MSDPSMSAGADVQHETHDDPIGDVTSEQVVPTGHAQIDEALERLDGLDDREITSHPEEFDAIHRVLRESLANAGRDGELPESP